MMSSNLSKKIEKENVRMVFFVYLDEFFEKYLYFNTFPYGSQIKKRGNSICQEPIYLIVQPDHIIHTRINYLNRNITSILHERINEWCSCQLFSSEFELENTLTIVSFWWNQMKKHRMNNVLLNDEWNQCKK